MGVYRMFLEQFVAGTCQLAVGKEMEHFLAWHAGMVSVFSGCMWRLIMYEPRKETKPSHATHLRRPSNPYICQAFAYHNVAQRMSHKTRMSRTAVVPTSSHEPTRLHIYRDDPRYSSCAHGDMYSGTPVA